MKLGAKPYQQFELKHPDMKLVAEKGMKEALKTAPKKTYYFDENKKLIEVKL